MTLPKATGNGPCGGLVGLSIASGGLVGLGVVSGGLVGLGVVSKGLAETSTSGGVLDLSVALISIYHPRRSGRQHVQHAINLWQLIDHTRHRI